MHTIEIDDDVFGLLKKRAEPFVDTPNSVLRKLLGLNQKGPNRTHSRSRTRSRQAAGKSAKTNRAPSGTLLPEQEYTGPILQVLRGKGGRAPAQEVIEGVGRMLADRLTTMDKENLATGGVRWQHRVQFARLRLLERGLLKKGSPRGLWELSDQAGARSAAEVAQ